MEEITRKTDSTRSVWYLPENPMSCTSEPSHWGFSNRGHAWRPPTDVYETDDSIVVRVEIAGMGEADFNISLEGRILAIRGIRTDAPEKRAYHQMEIRYGEFIIEVELPNKVNTDAIEASYKDGLLRVVLPKTRPFHVKVED
jgi:HSP20 family protein